MQTAIHRAFQAVLKMGQQIKDNDSIRKFADGQLYVALSRVKDINNLYVTKEIRPSDIKVNQKVLEFYSKYESGNRLLSA